MSAQQVIANAISNPMPMALVETSIQRQVMSFAQGHGYRVATLPASALREPLAPIFPKRAKQQCLLIIEGCEASAQATDLENILLDVLFDGHPAVGETTKVVLAFAHPTMLSDSLADDDVPCDVISTDMLR